MGEVIDLATWRQRRESEPKPPRRRRTPGGHGFDDDQTRFLSSGLPQPAGPDDSDSNDR